MTLDYDVIVAGGGLAGLRAARDLSAAGQRVLLLEAADRLGGRIYYDRYDSTDLHVELGGGWFNLAYQPELTAEVERYAVPIGTNAAGSAIVRWLIGGQLSTGSSPVPLEHFGELERAMFAAHAAARRIQFGTAWDQQDLADLDISWQQFIDDLDVPAPVAEWLGTWPSSSTSEETNALHLLGWVAAFDTSLWRTYAEGMLYRFTSGTKSLVDALAADSGAEIRLGTPVAAIEQDDAGVTVRSRSGTSFTAAAVVVALPRNVWRDVEFTPALSKAKREASAELHSGQTVKLWVTLQGAPAEGVLGWGVGEGLNWLFRVDTTPEGDLYVGFSGGQDFDPTDRAAVERAVHAFIPEASVVRSFAHDWRTDEFQKGTWMVQRPGEGRLHSGLAAPEGRVVFAGGDVSFAWNGWMEGALETGGRAAQEVLATFQESGATAEATTAGVV